MAPKKKTQKMALSEFFADETTGSWADEMVNLPTAPAARVETGPKPGEPGYLDSMPDRSERPSFNGPPRAEVPLPTVPPFTAFIGNLTYETDEDALRDYFADLNPTAVRLVKDNQGSAKGFGYVEFPSQDDLKAALGRNQTQLQGRSIRVSVAEAPSSKREFAPSAADEASQWRRSGPLPARETPAPQRQGSYGAAPTSDDRDWSSARGARFTPSVPSTPSGFRREFSGPPQEREPSVADGASQWRSAKPLVEARGSRDLPPQLRGPESGQSSPSLADTEQTWSRGTKLRTPTLASPVEPRADSPADDRDWRGPRANTAAPPSEGDSPAAPAERRKLNLAPRSASNAASSNAGNSSSIFGAAKPVDSAARDREAAEKLAKREQERKQAREAEAKREEDKGRQFAEERAQAIRDAQEKAKAEALGKPLPSSAGQHKGGKRTSERKVGEDGFEVAKGGRVATQNKPATIRKESTTRTGFSFAAAAGRAYGAENDKVEGVDEVTEGVKQVSV